MVATDTKLDKFEEAFVSTQENKILCSNTPSHQEEVMIEDITYEKEEEKMEVKKEQEKEKEKEKEEENNEPSVHLVKVK